MERVAVTGAGGLLGRASVAELERRGHAVRQLTHGSLDITRHDHLARLRAWAPTTILNCAAWTDVDGCARDPQRAMAINGAAVGDLAAAAAQCGARLVHISTNEVFDGALGRAYRTDDVPNPVNPYGHSKLEGELRVQASGTAWLIVRTAWLFGWGRETFVTKILSAATKASERGDSLHVVADEEGNPTWVPALAGRIADAIEVHRSGIAHLAGVPVTTRFDWATEILAAAGVAVRVDPIDSSEFARASNPPRRAVLDVDPEDARYLDWREPCASYVVTLAAGATP
jgi:dTDP-4-dehydrorhamnose reductase